MSDLPLAKASAVSSAIETVSVLVVIKVKAGASAKLTVSAFGELYCAVKYLFKVSASTLSSAATSC